MSGYRWVLACAFIASGCSRSHEPSHFGATGLGIEASNEEPGPTPNDQSTPTPSENSEVEAPVAVDLADFGITEGQCPADFSTSEDDPIVPPLPPSPAASELPPECDEEAALARAVAACGPIQRVDVTSSLSAALAECAADRFCHVAVPAGDYVYEVADDQPPLRCTLIEGAGAEQTRIATSGFATAEHVVLARLHAHASYGVVSAEVGPLLVNEVDFVGGYEGVSLSWGEEEGAAICSSNVRGGYVGVDLSWESSNLVVAGSRVAACYEGVGLSWMSFNARVVGSSIFGAYAAVSTSWGSHHLTVQGNELASTGGDGWPGAAVNLHNPSAIEIRSNVVTSGTLPSSDPAAGVIVEDNELP